MIRKNSLPTMRSGGTPPRPSHRAPAALLLLAALLPSCAGDGSRIPVLDDAGSGPFAARLSKIQTNVLSPLCAPGCHQPGGIAPFNMQTAVDSYANLVDVPNLSGVQDPRGRVYDRVERFHPDRSYMILKLRGAPGIVGDRMPLGQPPLDPDVIDTIAEWIQSGARND